jgi:hypothetical protein
MMCFRKHHITICRLLIFILLYPAALMAETKNWTGFGGDENWSDPLNWSGASLPQSSDDVILDNGDLPVSYKVILPDTSVVLRTLRINPSPGRSIELVLPPTNKITNAFTVTGPGYGIELNAGAVFRNASGLSSGESLQIADSLIIHDGGRYIHQTRASHANSILKFLSTAPGTEQGVFDFDVPKASYTISVSNRIYGSLELHADSFGSMVNYTCAGANPVTIRGDLRIGANVSMSMDLSGANGNVQVEGDFIQEGGQMNLASGTGDNTVIRVKGNLYQLAAGSITETANGNPFLELNGEKPQEITMAGRIQNRVGFRMNNMAGATLRIPLILPWKLELNQGAITSSTTAMLLLDTGCEINMDSSRLSGIYIDGPMSKRGLNEEDHFLFPVGKDGNLRWLELKGASGNYTVEYFRENPNSLGTQLGEGLDHISKLEYWTVHSAGGNSDQAKIELSFAAVQSGGVTDPNFLNIAGFQSAVWEDVGHTGKTGNFIQGSVISAKTDFAAGEYTLASVLNLENPLPLTTLDLQVKEVSDEMVFSWVMEGPETADHFEICEETGGHSVFVARIKAEAQTRNYSWTHILFLKGGNHFFRIRMIDLYGNEYPGKLVLFRKAAGSTRMAWISTGAGRFMIRTENPDLWKYEFISISGQCIQKGTIKLNEGENYLMIESGILSAGIYVFHATDSYGKSYSLIFKKE